MTQSNTERPTATLTTEGGHTVVHKTYITKAEERQITEIYVRNVQEGGVAQASKAAVSFSAEDKTFEILTVSLDGSTENIVERSMQLPNADYNQIALHYSNILKPEKK